MTRRIRASLLGAAVLLAACGGGQDQSGGDSVTSSTATPETTTTTEPATTTTLPVTTTTTSTTSTADGSSSLMASLDATSEVTSARIEGSIEMTGLDESATGVSDGVILFSSSFDATTGDSSFLMDMSSMLGSLEVDESDPFAEMAAGMFSELEFRQVGETSYVKFPFFTTMFGAETEWVSMPADEGEAFAADFETVPTDPNEVLSAFDEQGASIDVVGSEPINGVTATHYQLTLDTEAMELTPEEEAELAESGIFASGTIPLDIWISDEGYMVRMIMEIDGSGIDAPPDEQFETMTLRYDVFDVNGDVVIEPPPASEVTPMEDLEGALGFEP